MSPDTKISRRDFLRVAGITAAGALLSTCVPPSSEKPTTVPTTVPPTEAPKTPEPVVDLTAEAAKKTTLNTNLTNLIPENGVFTQGIGGEISGVFGDPKITGPLSSLQIDAARAMLGRINPGTLYAVPNGKAVIQRLTGVKDGIDYSNKPDAEVPFKVTVTMLPNTFLQKDGEYVILPEETKPGEARYIRTNDQTKWNVTTSFLVEPGFLPTGAALWWDAASMGMQPVIWDGDGNPRLMGNLQVDVMPVVVAAPTALPTEQPTQAPTETSTSTEIPQPTTIKFELTDGTTWEMPEFHTAEDLANYIAINGTVWKEGGASERSAYIGSFFKDANSAEDVAFNNKFNFNIVGFSIKRATGMVLPPASPNIRTKFFGMFLFSFEDNTLIKLKDKNGKLEALYVTVKYDDLVNSLPNIDIPAPEPQG